MTRSLDIEGVSPGQADRLIRASDHPGPWTKSRLNTLLRQLDPEPALAALTALRERIGDGPDVLDAICLWRLGDDGAPDLLDDAIAKIDDLPSLTLAQQVLLDMTSMGLPWDPARIRAIWSPNFEDRTGCIRDMATLVGRSAPDTNQMALASFALGRAVGPDTSEARAIRRASLIRLHDLSLTVARRHESGLPAAPKPRREIPETVLALADETRSIVSLASHWGCTFINPIDLGFVDHRPIRIRFQANPTDETAIGNIPDAGGDTEMIRELRRGRAILGFAADTATGRTPIAVPAGDGRLTLARSAVMVPRLGDAALIYADMCPAVGGRVLRACLGPDPRDFGEKEPWRDAVIEFCRASIRRTIEDALTHALDPVWDGDNHRRLNI